MNLMPFQDTEILPLFYVLLIVFNKLMPLVGEFEKAVKNMKEAVLLVSNLPISWGKVVNLGIFEKKWKT